ncbi:MAG: hypothetical protein C0467_32465 [Planctomycetaceae bacterium]|nr:hypothetical protein [Planctomycetaceae bacterium]
MHRAIARLAVLVGVLTFANPTAAHGEKLTKVEIGKRGKAATAFVDVPKGGTGTAFCIHPSGLFITNEHVVRAGAKEEITLVLNPSVQGERVLKARVVRMDKELDLALLRVDGAKELPSLPLGSIKDVAELSDVVACGFPLGFALSGDKKNYPAISVNAGSVTALRYKGRELEHIQIDVSLTFGNSGGPVLDETGKIIGVVVGGLGGVGKGINKAIPVSHLEGFLNKPDVAFTPPELTRETLAKPIEFKANVVSFVPGAPEVTLKLMLQAGDDEAREFPMKKQADVWVATAAPVAKTAASRVEISARIGTGVVSGTVEDAVFKVGGKPVRLSGVKRIELKTKPGVLLADGRTTVEGEITGLGTVELDVGGQKLKVDLLKATQVTVAAAPEIVSVLATVVAIAEGKEVARTESRMVVREAALLTPADPTTVKITPPALDDDKVVKRLPEVFDDVVVGGGGRYLIFHMPKLKKLAIFDVNEARVTKYIPVSEDVKGRYAASLDSVVIGLRGTGKLERWSLTTFELEKSSPPSFKEEIGTVVMGHGSNGPVVINGQFFDLANFKPMPVTYSDGKEHPSIGGGRIASGDGTVFGAWNTRNSPASATAFVLENSTVKRYDVGDLRHVVPGPDGRTVFTGKGIVSRTLQSASPDDGTYGYCLPAVRGDYFLSLSTATAGKGGGFTVYLKGLNHPVAKLDKADHGISFDGWDREEAGPWRRVFFVPDANVIAVLPSSNDRVVLHKFDADAALEKSGHDYLIVTSQAPREVKVGTTFTYPIKVKSKQGGVTFKLDSGPKGMAVSAEGVITWAVPAEASAGDHDVILTVRDKAGQEVFHTFLVKVVK